MKNLDYLSSGVVSTKHLFVFVWATGDGIRFIIQRRELSDRAVRLPERTEQKDEKHCVCMCVCVWACIAIPYHSLVRSFGIVRSISQGMLQMTRKARSRDPRVVISQGVCICVTHSISSVCT